MVDLFPTRAAVELQGQAVADGLRNVMLLVRQLRERGYEVTPDGLGVVEGLIFMETTLLGDYVDQVKAVLALVERLGTQSRAAVNEIEAVDAEIGVLVGAIRRCLRLLCAASSPEDAADTRQLIEDALTAIEGRLVLPEPDLVPEPPKHHGNVVAFPSSTTTVAEGTAS